MGFFRNGQFHGGMKTQRNMEVSNALCLYFSVTDILLFFYHTEIRKKSLNQTFNSEWFVERKGRASFEDEIGRKKTLLEWNASLLPGSPMCQF